jgi:hypothetical protein
VSHFFEGDSDWERMIWVWPRLRLGGRAGSREFALVHSRVVRLPGPEIQIHPRQQD